MVRGDSCGAWCGASRSQGEGQEVERFPRPSGWVGGAVGRRDQVAAGGAVGDAGGPALVVEGGAGVGGCVGRRVAGWARRGGGAVAAECAPRGGDGSAL